MKSFLLRSVLCVAAFVLSLQYGFGQVAIGASTPDAKAMLDIVSSDRGLLIPRMLQSAREGINPPTTGLMVYQTNGATGFYYYDGSAWKRLLTDVPAAIFTGFSASIPTYTLTPIATQQITSWLVASPYYSGSSFNPVTGNYTVPETGTYAIQTIINYRTTSAQTIALSSTINPYFAVRRISPISTELAVGYIPTFNVNIALILNLRTILEASTITLSNNVQLNAGDVISLFYMPNGLNQTINLEKTSWSITRIN